MASHGYYGVNSEETGLDGRPTGNIRGGPTLDDARHVMALADSWSATGESLLLMTDFDGTLTPIVDDPDEAWLTEEMRGYLRSLARSPRSRITVVSGRGLDDLRSRVRVPGVTYAGCHGLEVAGPDFTFSHPEAESQVEVLREVSRALLERAPLLDGLRVERKRLAVAVHYRHLTAAARHRLEDELARAILQDGARLKIFHGTKVVEILPAAGWNKGSCALWILEQARRQLGPAMRAFYLGDDWTDEHAFEALAGQAITVRVGSDQRASKAGYRLETIEQVRELLSTLASRVEEYGRGSVGVL
jgi:trehalose-phosphatase